MNIFIDRFGGIVPRQPEHSLHKTQATKAHNVRLRRNRLEPWREPKRLQKAPLGAYRVALHGDIPLFFSTPVSVAEISPDWARLYVTGNADYPQVIELDEKGNPTFYRLGVPQPTNAPMAVPEESICSRASDSRSYVYTYVNRWGEESAPSNPSDPITVEDGATVTVTGLLPPPDGYGIDTINLYRTVTGARDLNSKQELMTDYLFVDSLPITAFAYTDEVLLSGLGPVLDSEGVCPPPEGLQNITALETVVRLCGSVDNRLYFTELFQPYNWAEKYTLTLDHTIKHIGAFHDSVFVTTDSVVYYITPPDCNESSCATIRPFSEKLPDIGTRSLSTPYGYIFVSSAGLILLKPDLSYDILTSLWLSPEEWKQVLPHTARMGLYQNYLFIITDIVSFVLNLDRDKYSDTAGGELSTISDRPIDLITTNTGELLLLENNELRMWDAGGTFRPFFWESRELIGQDGIRTNITFGAARQDEARGVTWAPVSAKIHTKGTKFSLISPVQDPAYERSVSSEAWFRLPRIGRNLWYKIRLEGIQAVDFVAMGTSNFTLNQGK